MASDTPDIRLPSQLLPSYQYNKKYVLLNMYLRNACCFQPSYPN